MLPAHLLRRVEVDVPGTTSTDMIDGSSMAVLAQLSLQLLIEGEDGAL